MNILLRLFYLARQITNNHLNQNECDEKFLTEQIYIKLEGNKSANQQAKLEISRLTYHKHKVHVRDIMIWILFLSHGFPIRPPILRGRDVEYRVFESIQPVFIIVMPASLLYGIIKARASHCSGFGASYDRQTLCKDG